ncbi:universal stress protein [Aestuariivirga sp.]|uniref:universal stress protein n=1 Tax=Aestuariivirga sp. TaxID=2650926 RepID=UPI0025C28B39|nr:universal stress protein [Aestuariivirga sp.]MCA3554467.1 universal stress protein [Aestuariivirga sp.]
MQKTLQTLRSQRRNRFRILACIDGTEDSLITVRFAARFSVQDNCDLIVLFVRPIDSGLQSGGLQVRLARENMLEAGFELPGVTHLKQALEALRQEGLDVGGWPRESRRSEAWGDPAGDNKLEFASPGGRTVVLKLKTAPDVASGILDQYELGPYNLIITGHPSRWTGELMAVFRSGIVQTVTTMAPCSVLVARNSFDKKGFFICTDGSPRSTQAVRRSAVLARVTGEPITLFSVAASPAGKSAAEDAVANAGALLKAMNIPVAETRVAVGRPAEEIVEAGSLYQVIVVTDEGRSRLARLARGSTATEVVRKARTSVLDVR